VAVFSSFSGKPAMLATMIAPVPVCGELLILAEIVWGLQSCESLTDR
jgi:hypothetical protein